MGFENAVKLPIIPLPSNLVLLPGTTLRIPVANRVDVAMLLSSAFSRATQPRNDRHALSVGCVPLRSNRLSRDGRQLLKNASGDNATDKSSRSIDPARATIDDLYLYGTVARIVGMQGRPSSDPHMIVEGVRRFRIDRFERERPYIEADVTMHVDDSKTQSPLDLCSD